MTGRSEPLRSPSTSAAWMPASWAGVAWLSAMPRMAASLFIAAAR